MILHLIRNYREIYPDIQGRELTDALICRVTGKSCMPVLRDEKGKPRLSSEGTFISVSHSNSTFALLVAEENVGMDIQYGRSVSLEKIAGRYFTPEEKAYVEESGEEAFFRLWARKEAFAKYTGAGMEQIMSGEGVLGRKDVIFHDMMPEEGLYCSVCCAAGGKEEEIEIHISHGE